jgi:hypothetical protein
MRSHTRNVIFACLFHVEIRCWRDKRVRVINGFLGANPLEFVSACPKISLLDVRPIMAGNYLSYNCAILCERTCSIDMVRAY